MKKGFLFLLTFLLSIAVFADEGMWLPNLVGQQKLDDMRKRGMRLTAEDLYSINQSSLKDAIVIFGRGCTGAIVSNEGLLLTNHHCGFGNIQRHSSVEHDYLTDGFWAMSREEELPNPGLSVARLVRMEDVTDQVLAALQEGMTEIQRQKAVQDISGKISAEAVKDTHYQGDVRPLFNGNQYFLYVSEVFKDVRLVGAPPSAIGNFGGDTDNWMWPRHTGDFSVFRIYADSNNKPAEYSAGNQPYRPGRALAVSIAGIDLGDFTMVYGFPGRTQQYLPSYMVQLIANESNPEKIAIRREKLDIMGAAMNADPAVRIQYANKYAGVANAWKKWMGESKGLNRFDAVEKKQAFESRFQDWASLRQDPYRDILPVYKQLVSELTPYQLWIDQFAEGPWSLDIVKLAAGYRTLAGSAAMSQEERDKELARLKNGIDGFFKDFDPATDQKLFVAMMEHFRSKVSPGDLPSVYSLIDKKFSGNIAEYANAVYAQSFFVSEEKLEAFLNSYKPGKNKTLLNDPVFSLMTSFYGKYQDSFAAHYLMLMNSQDSLQRMYMKAIMEMEQERILYPDANSTLRISFGVVDDYQPRDGIYYDYQTTLEGIMEKDNPDIYDYRVPARLKELYDNKDFGRYGEEGTMPVCFTAANHTTGGNSGSPVLNAGGELIGLNFDRNWEGTMSDIMYDPEMCRNIVLDIRYCLFIMDKYAGAGHLVREMQIKE